MSIFCMNISYLALKTEKQNYFYGKKELSISYESHIVSVSTLIEGVNTNEDIFREEFIVHLYTANHVT